VFRIRIHLYPPPLLDFPDTDPQFLYILFNRLRSALFFRTIKLTNNGNWEALSTYISCLLMPVAYICLYENFLSIRYVPKHFDRNQITLNGKKIFCLFGVTPPGWCYPVLRYSILGQYFEYIADAGFAYNKKHFKKVL
jgi:hypothetical protein